MKPVLVASLVVSLCGALPAVASDDIKVMTLNQYLGGDLGSLIAPAGGDFNAAVVAILEQIAATDFPARVERQAREIARRKPHLIGLQEVLALSCSDFDSADEHGCEDPTIAHAFRDYLDETLDALAAQGADYHDVAIVENLDLRSIQIPLFPPGLPFFVDGVPAFLVAIDRDVILARTDVGAVATDLDCAIPSEDGCNYQFVLGVEVPIPPDPIQVSFERGFVGVDVTVDSKSYRFVNTHLEIREPVPRQFQCEQAAELIETLADTPAGLSLIVVGDLNSSPEDEPVTGPLQLPEPCTQEAVVPPYMQFVDAGYTDIWTLRPGDLAGFTCCQAPDLRNRRSTLDERIDFIFSAEPPAKVRQARVVGASVADKTPPPGPRLWPSDHGGVVATLQFERMLAAR
jgi:endonuclease/exonuclease/phosphatase family metal-dependent hydrolase